MSVPTDQLPPGVTMAGLDNAVAKETVPGYDEQMCADVKVWQQKIKEARDHDKPQRKRYALNRRYARNEGKFKVNVPIAGPYIDILTSFLYARNPDLDVQPSESTAPPPMAQIIEMARAKIVADPATQQMMIQVGQQATIAAEQVNQQAALGGPQTVLDANGKQPVLPPAPVPAEIQGEMAAQAWLNTTIKNAAKQIMAPYRQRISDAKQFGKTIELVVAHLWKKAQLKLRMDPNVRSGLTVGVGWLKATWQERDGTDPLAANRQQDMQDGIAKLKADQDALDEGEADDVDATRASVDQQIAGLEANTEVQVSKGMAVDYIRAEDMTLPAEVSDYAMYVDSPWLGHRLFALASKAPAMFPDLTEDDLAKASNYWPRKLRDPKDKQDVGPIDVVDINAEEADQFVSSKDSAAVAKDAQPLICIHEIWVKETNTILTLIEGITEKYARAPYNPEPGTTRFYPFFQLAFIKEDGQRHPASLVDRTSSLLDDISRLFSRRDTHRQRAIPKSVFDKGNLSPDDASRIEGSTELELIGIEPTIAGSDVSKMFHNVQYPGIDKALYSDQETMAKVEISWGIQEALASSIQTAKTATEAEIQQTGTNARTTHKRDAIDMMLDDLAAYTTEIAVQKMSHDEVVAIAGPWALWPENMDIQQLGLLVNVTIKGGSTGKPDTAREQQSWATVFPLLENAIKTVGQLRQSDPSDIADCIQELMEETLSRTGDRLDVSRFLPPAPSQEPGNMPTMPGAAPPGQPMPAPGAGAAPMPAQQTPPNNPNTVPVPHNGHVLSGQHHIVQPGASQ